METMCPPGCQHNGFVATHALDIYIYTYLYLCVCLSVCVLTCVLRMSCVYAKLKTHF